MSRRSRPGIEQLQIQKKDKKEDPKDIVVAQFIGLAS